MNLKVEGIDVRFGQKEILKDITMELQEEQLVMLLGLNGSGKTTLIRTLLGLQKPVRGWIQYGDKEMNKMSQRERSKYVAYVPQFQQIAASYSVFDFILLGVTPYLSVFQVPGKKEKNKVDQVLEEFHILHLRNEKMNTLSGGERQIIYFARAKVQDTSWMVLDEPMASLDYVRQHEFIQRVKKYQIIHGQGVFLSVHDPNMALTYADSVVVLHERSIQGIIQRSQGQFEQKLTTVLNTIYDGRLGVLEQNHRSLYYWKEKDTCLL